MKIKSYYPNYFFDTGIAGAAYHFIKGMQSPENDISLMGIASEKSFQDAFYSDAIPRWAKKLAYKILPEKVLLNIAESLFIHSLKDSDFAYLWPGVKLDTYRKLKNKGYKIIHECVNTHEANSKLILDEAYAKLKLPATHGIDAQTIAVELEKLALSDYIYTCSPIMSDLLLKIGVPKQKILQSSYGLGTSAIVDGRYSCHQDSQEKLTFLFVGSISVRKGAHLLLDYWAKANLNANLILVGTIEPALKTLVAQYVGQHNVTHVSYTLDLASIYKEADVFILPSLEEGSPLVTYMAMGAGIPMLLTPMSAGGVVTNDIEGLIIEPYDVENWINSMRKIAEDAQLRERFAAASKLKAPNYLWGVVAKQRLDSLIKAINQQ